MAAHSAGIQRPARRWGSVGTQAGVRRRARAGEEDQGRRGARQAELISPALDPRVAGQARRRRSPHRPRLGTCCCRPQGVRRRARSRAASGYTSICLGLEDFYVRCLSLRMQIDLIRRNQSITKVSLPSRSYERLLEYQLLKLHQFLVKSL